MFNDKRRGDLYWLQDNQHRALDTHITRGDRPCVIVSSNRRNQVSDSVTVLPLSSSPNQLAHGDGYCDNVLLLGYGEPSVILTQQIRTVDKLDLQYYIGSLTPADMARVDAALDHTLGR